MDANKLAALRTGPLVLFGSNELPDTGLPDALKIIDHAHAIPGSVPLIQMVQPGTGKAVTTEAVPDFGVHDLLAVFDSACDAGFCFAAVVSPATGACLPVSCICATETAVHSTGSDQG